MPRRSSRAIPSLTESSQNSRCWESPSPRNTHFRARIRRPTMRIQAFRIDLDMLVAMIATAVTTMGSMKDDEAEIQFVRATAGNPGAIAILQLQGRNVRPTLQRLTGIVEWPAH